MLPRPSNGAKSSIDYVQFKRPFRKNDHVTWAVVIDADGKVVAQGTHEMCDKVIEKGPF